MKVQKLTSTDGFLVVDLDGAEKSVGVVRLAPKVLVDGAELLARAVTYSFATFGVKAGGASAGVNAKPEQRDAAVAAFVEEVAPLVASGTLHLSPGTALTADDLAALDIEPQDESLAARGAVAAAAAFLGGAAGGRSATVAGGGSWLDRLAPWWADAGGGELTEGGIDSTDEVLFVAGRAGTIDHEAPVAAKLVVPLTPVPVTAKAYAAFCRNGIVLVPDAVTCAAPLLAIVEPDAGDPIERVAALATELAPAGVDAWLAMVERAEAFLSTWQPSLPFGRPLA